MNALQLEQLKTMIETDTAYEILFSLSFNSGGDVVGILENAVGDRFVFFADTELNYYDVLYTPKVLSDDFENICLLCIEVYNYAL